MVQNKKIDARVAFIAAVIAMSSCGSAWALPEMQVGTRPPIVAPQSSETTDSTAAETEDAIVDTETQDTVS